MIKWTVFLITLLSIIAGLRLIVQWMIFQLLPSVAILALHLFGAASFFITVNLALRPKRTLDGIVLCLAWVSSQVLGVVGIDTKISIVLGNVGTKDSLVFIQVEILVLLKIVKKLNHNLVLLVCKRAVISVIALVNIVWMILAELSLVTFRMIQLLQLVMSIVALVAHWARNVSTDKRAHWRGV